MGLPTDKPTLTVSNGSAAGSLLSSTVQKVAFASSNSPVPTKTTERDTEAAAPRSTILGISDVAVLTVERSSTDGLEKNANSMEGMRRSASKMGSCCGRGVDRFFDRILGPIARIVTKYDRFYAFELDRYCACLIFPVLFLINCAGNFLRPGGSDCS